MDLELKDKRAIITGGSRGIGKSIAMSLSKEGAKCVIVARNKKSLDVSVDEIKKKSNLECHGIVADTGDNDSVKSMVNQSIELIGGIDILVNCAAKPLGQKKSGIEDKSIDEKIIEEINIKVMGYLRCSRAVIPFMKQNGWGRIINIAGLAYRSSGNIVGSIRNVSVSALTKNLADELGPHGINVSVIHPGFTITERTENLVKSMAKERTKSINDIWNEINQNNSVKQKIFSNDIAYIATILASPKSIAINGDGIAAGGGVSDSIYY